MEQWEGSGENPVSTDYLPVSPVRLFSSECSMLWELLKELTAVDESINVPVFRLRFLEITKLSSVLKIDNGLKCCSSFISSDGAAIH
jgi:hypothetical protein